MTVTESLSSQHEPTPPGVGGRLLEVEDLSVVFASKGRRHKAHQGNHAK